MHYSCNNRNNRNPNVTRKCNTGAIIVTVKDPGRAELGLHSEGPWWAKRLRQHLMDMKCTVHDLEVMGTNPDRIKLGCVVLLSKSYLNPPKFTGLFDGKLSPFSCSNNSNWNVRNMSIACTIGNREGVTLLEIYHHYTKYMWFFSLQMYTLQSLQTIYTGSRYGVLYSQRAITVIPSGEYGN